MVAVPGVEPDPQAYETRDFPVVLTASLPWARQDSNLRVSGYEPGALPLSYGPTAFRLDYSTPTVQAFRTRR